MIILRQKEFSVSTFGKNEQFRNDLYKLSSVKPVENKDGLPADILRLFSVERKHGVKNNVHYDTKNGTMVWICGEEKILNQLSSGKTPMGIRKTNETRVVLAYTTGTEYFAIGWYVDDEGGYIYKVSKETAPSALITRGMNRLFGQKNFKIHYETDSLQDAFLWIDNNVITITTYV